VYYSRFFLFFGEGTTADCGEDDCVGKSRKNSKGKQMEQNKYLLRWP
jgi:hypothetical protein